MTIRIAVLLVVALLGLASCDDDGASVRDLGGSASSGSGSGSGTGVASGSGTGTAAECVPDAGDDGIEVVLDEFSITSAEDEVTSGPARFLAINAGEIDHELLLVEARNVAALPLDGDSGVDEDALGERIVAGVERVAPQETCLLEVDLEADTTYVLLCNIVDEGENKPRSHFLRGMRTRFKVT